MAAFVAKPGKRFSRAGQEFLVRVNECQIDINEDVRIFHRESGRNGDGFILQRSKDTFKNPLPIVAAQE